MTEISKAYRSPQSAMSTYLKDQDAIEKHATDSAEISERK
jgi:hypothetical protein